LFGVIEFIAPDVLFKTTNAGGAPYLLVWSQKR